MPPIRRKHLAEPTFFSSACESTLLKNEKKERKEQEKKRYRIRK